jgi:hypothetical protein
MKKIMLAVATVLFAATIAQAETVQIDDAFTKANQWLSKENLSITGSVSSRDDFAAFSQEAILFYGEGYGNTQLANPSQKEGMAKRAAVLAAQRSVAEYLEGFAVISDSASNQGIIIKDVIRSTTASLVKGAQIVFQEYSKDKDTAIAILKIGMHGPKGFASQIYEKMGSDSKFKDALKTDKKPFKAQTVKLDDTFDGLIIDATEQNFRPAIINRVFAAKGDVLYDPAKVSKKVLVEQGCGEYTNSIDKAKVALAARGVKNPLVVKASGATSAADLQVSDEDAVTIYSANQKGNFMAQANVAFVMK